MKEDFQDFLNNNTQSITKNAGLGMEFQEVMTEIMQDDFEKFKADLLKKYNPYTLFQKGIDTNNLALIKQFSNKVPIKEEHIADIIRHKRKDIFDYLLTNHRKEVDVNFESADMYYFSLAIQSNFIEMQEYILNNYVTSEHSKRIVKETTIKELKDTQDMSLMKNILTSPVLKNFIDINEVFLDSMNYAAHCVRRRKQEQFDIIMSKDIIKPVDLYQNDNQALFYAVIHFSDKPKDLHHCHFFNHFLYDKKVQIDDNFIKRFSGFPALCDELVNLIAKRDLFFKIDNEFNTEDKKTNKIKL